MDEPRKSIRVPELDAVRGIAAFVVLLHHCWQSGLPDQNTFPFFPATMVVTDQVRQIASWVSLSPLRLLFAGHAAVGLFFVLSGFVLTRSLDPPYGQHCLQYLIRRIFRIWVPFAFVVLCAAALVRCIAPEPIANHPWLDSSWNVPLSLSLVVGHLLMLGTPTYVSLDNPMWSLVHEMRISMLFPLLVLLTARWPRVIVSCFTVFFMALSVNRLSGSFTSYVGPDLVRGVLASVVATVRYSLFFIFGILLSQHAPRVSSQLRGRIGTRSVLWILALGMLWLPFTAGYVELAYAVGSVLLLALCLNSPDVRTVLRRPVLAWLGRVSYSLYLVHLLVLLSLMHLLYGRMPVYAIMALVIAASLILAELINRYVELPANALGKTLAIRLPLLGDASR